MNIFYGWMGLRRSEWRSILRGWGWGVVSGGGHSFQYNWFE